MAKKTTILLLAILAGTSVLQARIGENRSSFEGRLLSKSDGGLEYESKEDKLREIFELPYRNMLLVFPKDTQNKFYFKRADTELSTKSDTVRQNSLDGWEIHVCFFKDISVMEVYRRKGAKITPEEIAGLLETTQEALKKETPAEWVKHTPRKSAVPALQIKQSENFSKAVGLLPKNNTRMVKLKVPEEVKSSINYDSSSANQILLEEKRRFAQQNKDKAAAEQAAEIAKRKADAKNRKSSSSSARDRSAAAAAEKKDSAEVAYGGISDAELEKRMLLLQKIPEDADTAFGYNLNLSDDSARVLLMPDGVLIIDSRFDKLLREELEKLWKEQEAERIKTYKDSIYRF